MIKILFLLLPFFLNAETLKELITQATQYNDLIHSKEYIQQAKSKNLESKNSNYFPTLDVGGFYQRDDEVSPFSAGDTLGAYAKVGFDIYDGGSKSALVKQATSSLNSSKYDTTAYKKSLALRIAKDFFNIKSLESSLNAREEAQKALQAQLTRMSRFYEAKMATKDDVDRVQADFDTNVYKMESIKFQILSLKSALELKVGKAINTLDVSSFNKTLQTPYETLDATKALISQNNATKHGAKAIDSFYYPNVRVEDTYNMYNFHRLDPNLTALGATPLDKQNTLLLTLNFRVFDNGTIAKTKEAVIMQTQALNSQISYQEKEQKIEFTLANARIKTVNARIKSAKSALKASTSAFITIEKKYNAGIVDYIVYLDALTKKTNATSLYESALNDLEIAYAMIYFYTGKNITEELQ